MIRLFGHLKCKNKWINTFNKSQFQLFSPTNCSKPKKEKNEITDLPMNWFITSGKMKPDNLWHFCLEITETLVVQNSWSISQSTNCFNLIYNCLLYCIAYFEQFINVFKCSVLCRTSCFSQRIVCFSCIYSLCFWTCFGNMFFDPNIMQIKPQWVELKRQRDTWHSSDMNISLCCFPFTPSPQFVLW